MRGRRHARACARCRRRLRARLHLGPRSRLAIVLAATGHLGWRRDRYCTNTQPSVMIVPVTADGHLVLVRHYLKAHVLELPAGTISGGEQAGAVALREPEEESGYAHADGAALRPMGAYYALPLGDEQVHARVPHQPRSARRRRDRGHRDREVCRALMTVQSAIYPRPQQPASIVDTRVILPRPRDGPRRYGDEMTEFDWREEPLPPGSRSGKCTAGSPTRQGVSCCKTGCTSRSSCSQGPERQRDDGWIATLLPRPTGRTGILQARRRAARVVQLALALRERPRHSRLTWPYRAWLALLAGTLRAERLAGLRLIRDPSHDLALAP